MSKRKLLFRVGNLAGGGAERNLITILKSLDREKFEIYLLAHQLKGIFIDEIPDDVHFYFVGRSEEHLATSVFPKFIYKKIEKKKYKWLIHNHSYVYGKLLNHQKFDVEIAVLHDIIPFIKNSKTPRKIGFIRNDLSCESYLTPELKKRIVTSSKKVDKLISVSEMAKEGFVKIGGERDKIQVIHNPIDADGIKEKAEIQQVLLKGKVKIIALGRLHQQKRYDRLLKAARILVDEGIKDFHISILGKGEELTSLKQMSQDLKLEHMVTFLGFKENPYPYIKAADIMVLASDHEGYPGVVAESMILHKPIVSTRVSGSIEALENGNLGILTERTVEDLANGMRSMILDKHLRDTFSKKLQNHSFPFLKKNVMPKLEKIFMNI